MRRCVIRSPRYGPPPAKEWKPTRRPAPDRNARIAENREKNSISIVMSGLRRRILMRDETVPHKNEPNPLVGIVMILSSGIMSSGSNMALFSSKTRKKTFRRPTISTARLIAGQARTVAPCSASLIKRMRLQPLCLPVCFPPDNRANRVKRKHRGTPSQRSRNRMVATFIARHLQFSSIANHEYGCQNNAVSFFLIYWISVWQLFCFGSTLKGIIAMNVITGVSP